MTRRQAVPFCVSVLAGATMIAWGVRLLVHDVGDPDARNSWVLWVVGADLVHDGIVVPVVLLVGWVIARCVPAPRRVPVQVGLLVSAPVLVVAWLPLVGSAAPVGNPSIQPLDYRTAVPAVLVLVWVVVLAWGYARRSR